MEKIINLSKEIDIKGSKQSKITLNFDIIRGRDLTEAERMVRAEGEANPMINFSLKYQAAIAAKISGMKYDDILDLPASDFTKITMAVASFLIS